MSQSTTNQKQSQIHKPVINKSETLTEKPPVIKPAPKAETFRQIPQTVLQTFTKDVVGGVLEGFAMQLLGQYTSETITQPASGQNQEVLMWKMKAQQAEKMREEERTYFIRKEQETKQRIVMLRQELKLQVSGFSREMVSWSKEVEIASFQAPADPNIYHEHFFDQLLLFVKKLRTRVNKSKHWLKAHNSKSVKKKGLWAMAQQGNTYNQEILFSGEHSVNMSG